MGVAWYTGNPRSALEGPCTAASWRWAALLAQPVLGAEEPWRGVWVWTPVLGLSLLTRTVGLQGIWRLPDTPAALTMLAIHTSLKWGSAT